MLGLIPLYFIGKYFSELAHEHNRSRWGFAILGIVVYFASQFILGLLLGIAMVATDTEMTSGMEIGLNLGGIVLGLGAIWLFYYLLKRSWEKKRTQQSDSQLLDDLN